MMIKALSGVSAILMVAAVFCWGMWQKTEAQLTEAQALTDEYRNAAKEQRQTINKLTDLSQANSDNYAQLTTDYHKLQGLEHDARQEITKLRHTANQTFVETPFTAGNDTTARRRRLLDTAGEG